LNELMEKICADTQAGPYKLVCLPDGSNLTDSPTQTISIMNTQSAAACSKAMGSTIDPRRFRGNIWYEGESAWEENDWVGKELTIAGVNLRVTEPIVRCAAIDASPETGQRDMPLLKSMQRHFGHVHFGVLADLFRVVGINRNKSWQYLRSSGI